MRNIFVLATLFVFFSGAMAYADEFKVVSCDLQKVAEASEPFKDAKKTAQKMIDPMKKTFEAKKKALENDIKAAGPTPDKKTRDAILKRQESYIKETQEFFAKVQNSEMTVQQNIYSMILEASKNYAAKNHVSLVVDSRAILFSDPTAKVEDVTKAMVTELNAVWRALPKK